MHTHRFHNFQLQCCGVVVVSERAQFDMSFVYVLVFRGISNRTKHSIFLEYLSEGFSSRKTTNNGMIMNARFVDKQTNIFQGCSFIRICDFSPSFNHLLACPFNGNSMVKNGFFYIPKWMKMMNLRLRSKKRKKMNVIGIKDFWPQIKSCIGQRNGIDQPVLSSVSIGGTFSKMFAV